MLNLTIKIRLHLSQKVPGIKNRGIKKCKAKDNQIIIHFSSVPLF